jgi:hypothetical protein
LCGRCAFTHVRTPPDEVPNQVSCQLTLTNFPLAFLELGQLQRQVVVLNDIMDKLGHGDAVENYVLSQGTLYWSHKRGRGRKLVIFTLFSLRGTFRGSENYKQDS